MNRNSIYNEDKTFKSPSSIVKAQQSLLASTPSIKVQLTEQSENENIEINVSVDRYDGKIILKCNEVFIKDENQTNVSIEKIIDYRYYAENY